MKTIMRMSTKRVLLLTIFNTFKVSVVSFLIKLLIFEVIIKGRAFGYSTNNYTQFY